MPVSYLLGGRDQEDCSSKPAWANFLPYRISKKKKKISAKTGLVEWLKWYCACQASVKPCVQTPVLPTLQMLDLETILRQLCFALKKKPENTYTHFSYILAFYKFHTLKKK
jgi:hypothetical protein